MILPESPVEGEQIVILPSYKDNKCLIVPKKKKKKKKKILQSAEKLNTDQHCVFVSFAFVVFVLKNGKLNSAWSQKMFKATM